CRNNINSYGTTTGSNYTPSNTVHHSGNNKKRHGRCPHVSKVNKNKKEIRNKVHFFTRKRIYNIARKRSNQQGGYNITCQHQTGFGFGCAIFLSNVKRHGSTD